MIITTIIVNHVQEEVTDLLLEAMAKHPESRGFIIDGFPANIEQARIFSIIVTRKKRM